MNRGILRVFDDFSQEMMVFLKENAYDSLDSFAKNGDKFWEEK